MKTKKLAIFFTALLFCLFIFSACSNDEQDNPGSGVGDNGGDPPAANAVANGVDDIGDDGGTPPKSSDLDNQGLRFRMDTDSTYVK